MHPLVSRRALLFAPLSTPKAEVWKFDRLDRIAKHKCSILGQPKVISTKNGKAVEFNGETDAIFLDTHPLAGAATWTWEVIFCPYRGGRPEQRFFHLQESGSQSRLLLETRLIGDQWCLDSFAASSADKQTLIDRTLLHPLDEWHHVAFRYDGQELCHFVNHKLELSAKVNLTPQREGKCSVGVRINKVDYFKGAVRWAKFTRSPLPKNQFQTW
ncbi:MAG: LamG domain-containing protein [Acidobacteria bacterium]|nr:LamG domain-containing protein [Acidobacteriota bacterium]